MTGGALESEQEVKRMLRIAVAGAVFLVSYGLPSADSGAQVVAGVTGHTMFAIMTGSRHERSDGDG
jgi:hypothetical protein